MVAPSSNRPPVQGKQVTDTDKDALKNVNVKDRQAALTGQTVIGGTVADAGKPAKPVTLHQDTTAATPKAAHVAEDIWGGQPPPSDLPPEFPSKPALPPRRRDVQKAQEEQDAAFARQMIEDELKMADKEWKTVDEDAMLAKRLQEEFDAPSQVNLELNPAGKIRVQALESQGYIFNKELGICISEDGESIIDLDQLNKMEEAPIVTETRRAPATLPNVDVKTDADVKKQGVDIKGQDDRKARRQTIVMDQKGKPIDIKPTDDQAAALQAALDKRRAAMKADQKDESDTESWSD